MSYVRACSASELEHARPLGVQLGDDRIALVRLGDDIHAIADECSHARILLSVGDVDADACTLECYGHGVRFDLTTGQPLDLPATTPVAIYPTKTVGGDVLVDLHNPIQEF